MTTTTQNQTTPELITHENFNIKNVIFKKPLSRAIPTKSTNSSTKSSQLSYLSLKMKYMNSKGQEQDFLLELPPSWCPGLYQATDANGEPKLNEWSLCYYIRGIKRENMTETELKEFEKNNELADKIIKILDKIKNKLSEHLKECVDDLFSQDDKK